MPAASHKFLVTVKTAFMRHRWCRTNILIDSYKYAMPLASIPNNMTVCILNYMFRTTMGIAPQTTHACNLLLPDLAVYIVYNSCY